MLCISGHDQLLVLISRLSWVLNHLIYHCLKYLTDDDSTPLVKVSELVWSAMHNSGSTPSLQFHTSVCLTQTESSISFYLCLPRKLWLADELGDSKPSLTQSVSAWNTDSTSAHHSFCLPWLHCLFCLIQSETEISFHFFDTSQNYVFSSFSSCGCCSVSMHHLHWGLPTL